MPDLLSVPMTQVEDAVEAIACAIEAEAWRPALLVGIGRGGLVPAVFLSHRLGVPCVSLDLSADTPGFGRDLLPRLAGRADILLVDDINDSGRTVAELRDAIGEDVRVAVLVDNIRSDARVDYAARTIDRAEERRWLVFPWEAAAPARAIEEEAREGLEERAIR